jgi:hypothetical protein
MKRGRQRGKRVAWALIAAVVVCGGTAMVWVMRAISRISASSNDCVVVERLGREWIMMVTSIEAAVETGPGEDSDILAVADRESMMSEKLRAAANCVSTPAFRDNFNEWADGAALTAQLQRDAVIINRPAEIELPSDEQANMREAAIMTDEASGALLQACPDVRRELRAG